MLNQNRKNQWKTLLVGSMAAACIAVPFTVASHADDMQPASSSTKQAESPMQVSGTVEKYYTDRSGLVTAMDLSTSTMGAQKVRFASSWASRLWHDNPVGSKLDGWVVKSKDGIFNLVAIGADRPNRFLTNNFHTGRELLLSTAWIGGNGKTETVTGELNKVIVSRWSEVLALELKDGTLILIPPTVKNQEGARRTTTANTITGSLFKGAEVTAWGYQVWNARGDISIYGQRIAATGISINGKTISAIGIQNMRTGPSLMGPNPILDPIRGDYGDFSPFDASMQKQAPAPSAK